MDKKEYTSLNEIEQDAEVAKSSKLNMMVYSILKRNIQLGEVEVFLKNYADKKCTNYRKLLCAYDYIYAELGVANIGGEKNKTRPVLVITPNSMNRDHTVVVVPLSTKFKLKPTGKPFYDSEYLLKKSDYPQLDADSMVKFQDIRCIDVVRIRQLICNVNSLNMKRMKKNLLAAMGY